MVPSHLKFISTLSPITDDALHGVTIAGAAADGSNA